MKTSSIRKASLVGLMLVGAAALVGAFTPKHERDIIANGQLLPDSFDCHLDDFTCAPGGTSPNCDYTTEDPAIGLSYTTGWVCTSDVAFGSTGERNTGTYYVYGVFISI